MKHGAQFALLLALAALLGVSGGAPAGSGKHQRKIIIHVPYYIKNHHHTHTVYKYVNKDKEHHGDAEGGEGLGQGGGNSGGSLEQAGQHADGGGSGSAEAEHVGGDDAEFIGHHFHQVDGEATHDSPQALGLHGEPQPVHHSDHSPVHHNDHPPVHHNDHHDDHHEHNGDFHHHRQNKKRQNSVRDEFPHHEQHGHYKHHGHHDHHDHRNHHGHDDHRDHHGHDHNHSHHGHSGDNPHFHSKFVVGANDGELHESDSSESSEQSGHRGFEPITGHHFFNHPRENHHHPGFNHGQHESFSRPLEPQEEEGGESLSQEDKYDNQPHQENFNTLQSEQRTDESQQYQNPSSADGITSFNRFHHDKYKAHSSYTREHGKKHKGKRERAGDRSRRQKYEVQEPSQEAPPPRSSHSSDYQPASRRKHTYDWR